jgi:hypothetical protein
MTMNSGHICATDPNIDPQAKALRFSAEETSLICALLANFRLELLVRMRSPAEQLVPAGRAKYESDARLAQDCITKLTDLSEVA